MTATENTQGRTITPREDLNQQLRRVNAVLRSGKGPQKHAKARLVEIRRDLAKLDASS